MRKKSFLIFTSIISVLGFYVLNRFCYAFATIEGDFGTKIAEAYKTFALSIAENPFMIGRDVNSLLAGGVAFFIAWFAYLYHVIDPKNYMKGQEHGSAKWGTKKTAENFKNKEDEDQNLILSATEELNMKKAQNFLYDRNKNLVIVGGSGSGKTFGMVKPNLMQLNGSYVVTDPKGTLLPETGHLFTENGYELRWFNTINFTKSLHYNPLVYIKSEKDILKLVNVLIENTKGEGAQSGEDFWLKSERLWLSAMIGYLYFRAKEMDCNIPNLLRLLEMSSAREDDEDYKNIIDHMFDILEEECGDIFPVKQYKMFKLAAGKTLKSILISVAARLSPFDIAELNEIMSYDELKLDEIGDRKTAFFVIMSDTDNTYAFVVAMMFYQLFDLLCNKADDQYGGVLPHHVTCVLDEFANIGKIPNFEKLIATIRSREISAIPILQSFSQLTAVYKDNSQTIIDNCDTFVFLGGKSTKTTEEISKMIGQTTIDTTNFNESRGSHGSVQINNSIVGRALIDPAEIGKIKRDECLVLISGTEPFKSKKYNPSKHKRFSYLADGGKSLFDVKIARKNESDSFLDNVTAVQEINLSAISQLSATIGVISEREDPNNEER